MACSVITVLGADVPDGSALTSSIGGLATQLPLWQGNETGPLGPWPGPEPGPGPLGLLAGLYSSCIFEMPDSPGRMVRMSAVGLYWLAVIPKACSSCGVATYSGPDQLRPLSAWIRLALVVSSSTTSREPRSAAMACALADCDRSWLGVTGGTGPPGPPLCWPLGPYTMSWFGARFGP